MTRSDPRDPPSYPLTEAQGRIVALADGLAERFAERAGTNDPHWSFPHENFDELHVAGYLRLVLPARYGGQGASVLDMVLAQEHLARGDAGTALVTAMSIKSSDDCATIRPGRSLFLQRSAARSRPRAAVSTVA